MQRVVWPAPFDTFMSWLSIIALDITAWAPSLECAPGSFNSYQSLVLWTCAPILLYLGALAWSMATASDGRPFKRAKKVTDYALMLLSLIHTLITVRIFQIFDCDSYDAGPKKKVAFLAADYKLSCDSPRHKVFEVFAYRTYQRPTGDGDLFPQKASSCALRSKRMR